MRTFVSYVAAMSLLMSGAVAHAEQALGAVIGPAGKRSQINFYMSPNGQTDKEAAISGEDFSKTYGQLPILEERLEFARVNLGKDKYRWVDLAEVRVDRKAITCTDVTDVKGKSASIDGGVVRGIGENCKNGKGRK